MKIHPDPRVQSTSIELIGAIGPDKLSEMAGQWVDELMGSLLEQGRLAEGGWPGTVSEARVRVHDHAKAHELHLSSPEGVQLARALNQEARATWRSCCNRLSPLSD